MLPGRLPAGAAPGYPGCVPNPSPHPPDPAELPVTAPPPAAPGAATPAELPRLPPRGPLGGWLAAQRGIGPGFDVLRLVLAFGVVGWHSFALGHGQD
jgi:hypothetical protein